MNDILVTIAPALHVRRDGKLRTLAVSTVARSTRC